MLNKVSLPNPCVFHLFPSAGEGYFLTGAEKGFHLLFNFEFTLLNLMRLNVI